MKSYLERDKTKPHSRRKWSKTALTPREREVALTRLMHDTAKEAATRLGITYKTMDTHMSNIYRKLKIHSLTGLFRYIYSHSFKPL